MRPSKIIMKKRGSYVLVFRDVEEGAGFRDLATFDRSADIALIRADGGVKKEEYYSSREFDDLVLRMEMTGHVAMEWVTAFDVSGLPTISYLYVCERNNMYHLVLVTGHEWPFLMDTGIRVRPDEPQDSIRELTEDFLQEDYGNSAIRLEPIYEEDTYDFEYGCPHCGWKGDMEDADVVEVSEGADEPVCPECEEPLTRMR